MEVRRYPDTTNLFDAMEARRSRRMMELAGAQPCTVCDGLTLMVCICEDKPNLCPGCQCPYCGQR